MDEPEAVEQRRVGDAAEHAREAARQRTRANDLEAQLEAARGELAHTRERLQYLHGLMPVRLARAAKRRFASERSRS